MKAVVKFIKNDEKSSRNDVVSRTLRKVGFIDDRYLSSRSKHGMPGYNEHWLVEIIRENQSATGGSFILKPIRLIPNADLVPMIHGMYELKAAGDAVILTPNDQTKFWVMSPESKRSVMGEGTRSLVINHGGQMWSKRKPPESVMEAEAKKLLRDLDD